MECYAVGCTKKIQKTKKNNLHCLEHHKMFHEKYKAYKSATCRIGKYLSKPGLLDTLHDPDILLVATRFHIAAHMRREYQSEAIKPEFRDEGHNKMTDQLLRISEKLLSRLEGIEFSSSSSSSSEDEWVEPAKVSYKTIKQDHESLEKELNACIKSNILVRSEIEEKLKKLVNILDKCLDVPICLHSSDIMIINCASVLLLNLQKTMKQYSDSFGFVDHNKFEKIARSKKLCSACVHDETICSKPGRCPADHFNSICNYIMMGTFKHPYDIIFESQYSGELVCAIREMILAERRYPGNYIVWFAPSDKENLLMELQTHDSSSLDWMVTIEDKKSNKFIKTTNLSKV